MRETFFTADLHLGHDNIRKYEPGREVLGGTTDEMNESLIRRWNRVVRPRDHVIVIGDWAMGRLVDGLSLTPRFNGTKTLIVGNHDRPFDGKKQQEYLDAGFSSVLHGLVHLDHDAVLRTSSVLGFGDISLCHFPYRRSVGEYDGRFTEYHPEDLDGELLLCGHVHSAWKFQQGQINVGVDVWGYRPRTLYELTRGYTEWATNERANQ